MGRRTKNLKKPEIMLGNYSDSNISKIRQEIGEMFQNISFNENQVRLMNYLGNGTRESHLRTMATMIIWNEANGGLKPPGMNTKQHFLMKMNNAKGWADFYQKSVNWFLATNPEYNHEEVKTWGPFLGTKKWISVLSEPKLMHQWMIDNLPSPDSKGYAHFVEKVNFLTGGRNDFAAHYEVAYNSKLDFAAVGALAQWFQANVQNADTDNADLPQTTMGMAISLDIHDVRAWQSGKVEQAGVESTLMKMFSDPNGKFFSSFTN